MVSRIHVSFGRLILLQCFCPNCIPDIPESPNSTYWNQLDLSHLGHGVLKPGTSLDCSYIRIRNTTHGDKQAVLSRGQLIHVVFWPTLLFIGGFVGSVFSSISLVQQNFQRHTAKGRKGYQLSTCTKTN